MSELKKDVRKEKCLEKERLIERARVTASAIHAQKCRKKRKNK